jgi:hypothetical protein
MVTLVQDFSMTTSGLLTILIIRYLYSFYWMYPWSMILDFIGQYVRASRITNAREFNDDRQSITWHSFFEGDLVTYLGAYGFLFGINLLIGALMFILFHVLWQWNTAHSMMMIGAMNVIAVAVEWIDAYREVPYDHKRNLHLDMELSMVPAMLLPLSERIISHLIGGYGLYRLFM